MDFRPVGEVGVVEVGVVIVKGSGSEAGSGRELLVGVSSAESFNADSEELRVTKRDKRRAISFMMQNKKPLKYRPTLQQLVCVCLWLLVVNFK